MLNGGYRQSRGYDYWCIEPNVGRVANGVPHRVDRLKGLGNAVVPQQIYPIYKAIADIEALQWGAVTQAMEVKQ
mgnify:CR=1